MHVIDYVLAPVENKPVAAANAQKPGTTTARIHCLSAIEVHFVYSNPLQLL